MDECIYRDAAIKAVEKANFYRGSYIVPSGYAAAAILAIPAADVRPVVRGKWIPDYDYTEYDYDGSTPLPDPIKFQDGWQCSLCGGYMPSETNFCPNCGALMEES